MYSVEQGCNRRVLPNHCRDVSCGVRNRGSSHILGGGHHVVVDYYQSGIVIFAGYMSIAPVPQRINIPQDS
jgi:hypothetical protein